MYFSKASRTSSVLIKSLLLKEAERIVHFFIGEVDFNRIALGKGVGQIAVDILKLRVILS